MTLKEIVSVSGKPGLFFILKKTRTGAIVSSIDEDKKKEVIHATQRASILENITVFANGGQENIPLSTVLKSMDEQYEQGLKLKGNTDEDYFSFFASVLPDFSKEKVYISDIKKIVKWYNILKKYCPDLIQSLGKGEENENTKVQDERKKDK